MKKIVILCIAAVSFAGCTGKKGVTAVAEDKGVLTKSAVAEEASGQLTEVFTSEIEPYKENDITPAIIFATSVIWSQRNCRHFMSVEGSCCSRGS